MLNAYFTIGIFEALAAFWVFYWIFADFGFSFSDLLGSGLNYTD
jgi:hypothetical protein